MSSSYLRLLCRCDNPDEKASLVLNSGTTAGVEIISDQEFYIYTNGDVAEINALKDAMLEYSVELIKTETFDNQNWVQNCQEIWTTVKVNQIELIPILDKKLLPKEILKNQIYIIPGTGFGTGHHESTRLCLELLQSDLIVNKPKTVLDLGTGNGVLAFGAKCLFDCQVTAIDNDPIAIANAVENQELNAWSKDIKFVTGLLDQSYPKYDLILANIYAETLVELKPVFEEHTNQGSYLILSGIPKSKEHLVLEAFDQNGWQKLAHIYENAWVGLVYSKS